MAEKKKCVHGVKTVSTYPPKDLFIQDAETIARRMASKKVSPKGIGSGIRMIQFFINRAGKNLPAARKRELEKQKKGRRTFVIHRSANVRFPLLLSLGQAALRISTRFPM